MRSYTICLQYNHTMCGINYAYGIRNTLSEIHTTSQKAYKIMTEMLHCFMILGFLELMTKYSLKVFLLT